MNYSSNSFTEGLVSLSMVIPRRDDIKVYAKLQSWTIFFNIISFIQHDLYQKISKDMQNGTYPNIDKLVLRKLGKIFVKIHQINSENDMHNH